MKLGLKIILFTLLFSQFNLVAQTKPAKIWATATFNKSEVQLGEPLIVTVTVYTSTWFTKPPVFEEIQIKGSLMVKLEQNGGATTATIGKKRYPAIQQRFVVYPNIIGRNTLPSFKVTAECPPEGGYKGVSRDVFSKERIFNVLSPPEGIDPKNYLASYNVSLKDYWNVDLNKVKAGDVLERRITINASGSLAATIPPPTIDSVDFGTVYLKSPILNNRQNQSSFSGTRTEIINYLLEKDGSFTIPEVKVSWYNLNSKSLEERTIEAIPIDIAFNKDLEFILSRQQELQSELEANKEEQPAKKEPFSFMGLNWWQLLLVILALVVIIRYLVRIIKKIRAKQKQHELEVLDSEEHYYKRLKKTVKQKDLNHFTKAFYSWYDRYRVGKLGPQGKALIKEGTDETLVSEIDETSRYFFANQTKDKDAKPRLNDILTYISKQRKQSEKKKKADNSLRTTQINP